MERYVILHNIRSAHNVGAIFRTADGAGVTRVYLVGYTPDPLDRFGRVVEEIKKTSLGATTSVAWEHHDALEPLLTALNGRGVRIVAVEQHERAVPYTAYRESGVTAYLFGNEVLGVPGASCESADAVIHIPMSGTKESLNVSVAAGIVLFHVRDHGSGAVRV